MTRFPFPSFLLKSIFITWLTEEGKGKEQLTTIIATTGKTFSKRHQHNFMIDTHDEGWAQPLTQKDSRFLLFLVGTLWVQLCEELQPFNQVKDSFLNSENKLKRGSPKDIKSGVIKSKSLLGTKAVSLARIKNIILLIGCWWSRCCPSWKSEHLCPFWGRRVIFRVVLETEPEIGALRKK